MQIIEAPNDYPEVSDVFLGGGISNCPDWQKELIDLLTDVPGVGLNPRRTGEFTEDIADEQITWEYHALRSVHTVFFWFPKETLCPITLLELGVFTQRPDTRLIVGTHPDYARRFDVIKQLELARPEVQVFDNIEDMASEYIRQIGNVVTFEEENPAEYLRVAENAIRNEPEYQRVLRIVTEEVEALINVGDVLDLHREIQANYANLNEAYINFAIKELEGKLFVITENLSLISTKED